ncbi:MAG: BRO family protein [Mediterraneibacter gnavus]
MSTIQYTRCDFYVDEENNIYMSRTQIGYALQYKNPQDAIKKIHLRHYEKLQQRYVEVVGDNLSPRPRDLGKKTSIFMYDERGILDVIRWSTTEIADQYFDWVYDIIQSIKKNGYYITSEKDKKWLGIRNESKEARRYETDQIKLFVEYAKEQGSKNADRYYVLFTKLINSKMGIQSGKRDELSQETLMELKSLETLVKMRIRKLIEKETPYKEIYQDVKMLVDEF